jgi:hypothetical protein
MKKTEGRKSRDTAPLGKLQNILVNSFLPLYSLTKQKVKKCTNKRQNYSKFLQPLVKEYPGRVLVAANVCHS